MAAVPRPRFQDKLVEPFTREEIERILQACKYLAMAKTNVRQPFRMQRPTFRRDKALIMFLLDTGLRASEICALRIGDVDLKTGEVNVRHGKEGGAKGKKGRTVYIGKGTRRTLWHNLVDRTDGETEQAPLFATIYGRWLNRDSLRLLSRRLGEQVDVKRCHPHRFRHIFAINYLRSHGDVLTLQALLGHTSLELVKHYATVAKIDLQVSNGLASPVDNWGL